MVKSDYFNKPSPFINSSLDIPFQRKTIEAQNFGIYPHQSIGTHLRKNDFVTLHYEQRPPLMGNTITAAKLALSRHLLMPSYL